MRIKKPSTRDVETLVSFLVDRNPSTVELAKEHLAAILQSHPDFHSVLENTRDSRIAEKARLFLEERRLNELSNAFEKVSRQGAQLDLEHGAFLLAKLAYPMLEAKEVADPLNRLAEDMERILEAREPTPSQAVGLYRTYFFSELGFRGNEKNYYEPENTFINCVLERRLGIPISLSCVYLLVARRLDMAAFGIGLPGHFIVGHSRKPGVIYVDPFHGGSVLSRNDCIELVRQRGVTFHEDLLSPTSNNHMLGRMMVNLMNIYTERGFSARAHWLGQIVPFFQAS